MVRCLARRRRPLVLLVELLHLVCGFPRGTLHGHIVDGDDGVVRRVAVVVVLAERVSRLLLVVLAEVEGVVLAVTHVHHLAAVVGPAVLGVPLAVLSLVD